MLTIFTIPKPFHGHIDVIQRNAIRSWLQLGSACEVILFGNDEGTAEVAAEFGVGHIPEVSRNKYGTPLVNNLFDTAQAISSYPLLCYVNADIILMGDFLRAVQQVYQQKHQFLIMGQRWDLDLRELLDFARPNWEKRLRDQVTKHGKLHPASGIDYFVFTRGIWGEIPPFAIGRTAWDSWLVYRARTSGLPVIDATKVVIAVHQNHDYPHYLTGKKGVWKGVEAERNHKLLGSRYHAFSLWDATHIITPDGLKSAMSMIHQLRRLETLPEMHPHLTPFVEIVRGLRSIAYRTAPIRRLHAKLLH